MTAFLETIRFAHGFNFAGVALRMVLAVLCGGLIGIEREHKRRPAGFRTHILICLGASLTTITSQYLYLELNLFTDLARLGAQVIAGIGFIGAGTIIITRRRQVKGLTTAAGLWASAIVGLAFGAGYYEGALLGCVLIIATIVLLSRVERWIMARSRNLNIYVQFVNIDDVGAIIAAIKEQGIRILDVDIHKHQSGDLNQSAVFSVRLPKRLHHAVLLSSLAKVENVRAIEEL